MLLLVTIIVIAYIINTYLYLRLKDFSTITAAILEEFLKTYGGFLAGNIILAHIVFGLAEGIIDIKNNGKKGLYPAIFSILGHLAFGYITITVFNLTSVLFYGFLAGVFGHMIYNSLIVGVVNSLNNRP